MGLKKCPKSEDYQLWGLGSRDSLMGLKKGPKAEDYQLWDRGTH